MDGLGEDLEKIPYLNLGEKVKYFFPTYFKETGGLMIRYVI